MYSTVPLIGVALMAVERDEEEEDSIHCISDHFRVLVVRKGSKKEKDEDPFCCDRPSGNLNAVCCSAVRRLSSRRDDARD